MKKCINCKWKGEDDKVNDKGHCPVCGDFTKDIEEPKEETSKKSSRKKKDNFDLNNDGKVDKKDISLAARVLRSRRKK
jgi:hypothetical protein